ncbi:MAG: flavin reductase family protein [Chloroflexi bacterium]|jgi:flavin reductase (DIM6/NTAB) family NADH-FMN oxidoreductase RutF|nr:flavin reductase family protein [Chloroflexota bacterium]MBT7081070.1 flavin reductase family protein [Chloroflexota bacterium]MBT7290391.1 flavin reductase family protein [Chloroflexota bacterium]
MKVRLGPSDTMFPVPAALIVSGLDQKTNVMTCAWIGIVSSTPPTLAISLHKNRVSLSLIKDTGEFSVNLPTASQFEKVDYCGLVSGKKQNKLNNAGFTTIASSIIDTPIIKECPYNIECKVRHHIELGDWIMILGQILETHVDQDKIDTNGKPDIAKIDPLVYCATVRQYWSIGKKLGNGFSAGRELLKEQIDKAARNT